MGVEGDMVFFCAGSREQVHTATSESEMGGRQEQAICGVHLLFYSKLTPQLKQLRSLSEGEH